MIKNPNQWFPHFSPTGKIASGMGEVWVEGNSFGVGWQPKWINDTLIIFNGANGVVIANTVTRERHEFTPGANITAGGGGRWAAWRTTNPTELRVEVNAVVAENTGAPSISRTGDLVYVDNYQSATPRIIFNGNPIAGPDVLVTPRSEGGAVVWSKYIGTHMRITQGWRGNGVEDLRVIGTEEFQSIPVPTPKGLYVLTGTHWGWFIRPWGAKVGYMYHGEFFNPDVICHGDVIHVVGSDKHGGPLLESLSINKEMVAIKDPDVIVVPPPPPPPPPPPSQEKTMRLPDDVYATFVAVVAKFPHTGDDEARRVAMEKAVQTLRARHSLRYVWKTEHANLEAPSKDGLGFVPEGEIVHGKRTKMFIWDMISGTSRLPNEAPLIAEDAREAYVLAPAPKDWLSDGQPPPPPPPSDDPDVPIDLGELQKTLEGFATMLADFDKRIKALEDRPQVDGVKPQVVEAETDVRWGHSHKVKVTVK